MNSLTLYPIQPAQSIIHIFMYSTKMDTSSYICIFQYMYSPILNMEEVGKGERYGLKR